MKKSPLNVSIISVHPSKSYFHDKNSLTKNNIPS
jgi:hypothetical protein